MRGTHAHRDVDLVRRRCALGAASARGDARKVVRAALAAEEERREMHDVRDLTRECEHARSARRDEHRDRRWQRAVERDVVNMYDLAIERHALATPQRAYHVDAFAYRVGRVRTLVSEWRDPHALRNLDAATNAEDRASVGDIGDRGPGAREQRGVARVGVRHQALDPEATRPHRARGHHRDDVVVELQVRDREAIESGVFALACHRHDVTDRELPADGGKIAEGESHAATSPLTLRYAVSR